MKRKYQFFALVIAGVLLLQACQKEDHFNSQADRSEKQPVDIKANLTNTFYSSTFPIGNGVVRAWVKQNADGVPVAVGVNLSAKALENLPSEPTDWVLIMPKNKGMNFYNHVLIDWNPQGHEPEHVYDRPHFDFHFYITTNEERLAIGPNDAAQFANGPDLKYLPPLYLQTPGGVPQMGAHWVDLMAPEFNGGVFSKTFIWGSYDGNVTFFEPMITREYLLSHPDVIVPLRQPEAFQRDGYYATDYQVSYSVSPEEYTVALLNLTYHAGE